MQRNCRHCGRPAAAPDTYVSVEPRCIARTGSTNTPIGTSSRARRNKQRSGAHEDRVRKLRLCAEACAGFDPAASAFALDWLKWNNPRNPFKPTPQDVREACTGVQKAMCNVVVQYHLPIGRHFVEGDDWPFDKTYRNLGPPPHSADCRIPPMLVTRWLRERIAGLLK